MFQAEHAYFIKGDILRSSFSLTSALSIPLSVAFILIHSLYLIHNVQTENGDTDTATHSSTTMFL